MCQLNGRRRSTSCTLCLTSGRIFLKYIHINRPLDFCPNNSRFQQVQKVAVSQLCDRSHTTSVAVEGVGNTDFNVISILYPSVMLLKMGLNM